MHGAGDTQQKGDLNSNGYSTPADAAIAIDSRPFDDASDAAGGGRGDRIMTTTVRNPAEGGMLLDTPQSDGDNTKIHFNSLS